MNNPCKKTNNVFLIMVISYLAASVLLSMLSVRSLNTGMMFSLIVGEAIVLVPGTIFMLFYRCDFSKWIPLERVKPSTIGLTVVLTAAIMPFLYFLNIVSQLFEENVTIDMMEQISDLPAIPVALIIGVFGPVCEELAFRGILFSGYKRSGKIVFSVIWSGFLFGIFHMNINQFGYAFAIGMISALLVEATGSLIPSLVLHISINSYNVLTYYAEDYITKKLGTDIGELIESEIGTISREYLIKTSASLLLPAVGGLTVAVVVFLSIAQKEGRKEYIREIFAKIKAPGEERVITFSGILGVMICIFMIFAFKYITPLIGG